MTYAYTGSGTTKEEQFFENMVTELFQEWFSSLSDEDTANWDDMETAMRAAFAEGLRTGMEEMMK